MSLTVSATSFVKRTLGGRIERNGRHGGRGEFIKQKIRCFQLGMLNDW
jgi:hypothetical protein